MSQSNCSSVHPIPTRLPAAVDAEPSPFFVPFAEVVADLDRGVDFGLVEHVVSVMRRVLLDDVRSGTWPSLAHA
eukprot:6561227-Prymnesium_polylepis.1